MRGWAIGAGLLSVVLHGAIATAIAVAPKPEKQREPTSITISEAPLPPKKLTAPPPPPPPPRIAEPIAPPVTAPKAPRAPKAPPTPPPGPAAPAAPAGPAAPFSSDLKLGGGDGPGLGVPPPPPADAPPPPSKPPKPKQLTAPPAAGDDACTEELVKPKPIHVEQPAFTQEAQDAQITGKVRVEISIGADGSITDAKVIAGLGYGLDEAALAAARASTFTPATRCGVAVAHKFVIGMRFQR